MFQQVSGLFPKSRTRWPLTGRRSGHTRFVFFFVSRLYVLVLLGRIRTSGRRLGQREDSCGDHGLWLLIRDEICEQSFLSASERGGRQARPTESDSCACRVIGAGQKFSQERPSERDRAVAPREGSPTSAALAEKVQAILGEQGTHSISSIPAIGCTVRSVFPILPPTQSLLRSPRRVIQT